MTKNDTYKRNLSLNERTWIAVAQAYPPFCNQLILEGDAQSVIDKTKLETAVEKASAANPGSRVTLKGLWRTCHLVDSRKSPRVREVDGSKWSGFDDNGAPFLAEPLSPDLREPACEVLIIHGSPLRLAFRTHHAIMDARGTFVWVEDIFRALRGESAVGSDSTVSDLDLGLKYKKKKARSSVSGYLSPLGTAEGQEDGFRWIRKQLTGRYRYLIAQIAVLLAKEAWSISPGNVLVYIPVDWRLLHQNIRTPANLSTAVSLEVKPETTHKGFTDELKRLVMEQNRPYSALNTLLPFIPFWLMRGILTKFTKKAHKTGRYPFSVVLTGSRERDFNLKTVSGEGFNCDTGFFIPPCFGSSPIFLAFLELENVIQLVATVPKVLATAGRFDALMDTIVSGLVSTDT
jgi:hypothetical protein